MSLNTEEDMIHWNDEQMMQTAHAVLLEVVNILKEY